MIKQLPHSFEAEQQVIGSILLAPARFPEIAAELQVSDFYAERHRLLWTVMADLQRTGRPLDLTSISAELKTIGKLESAGGADYLVELFDVVSSTATVGYYCRVVRDHASRRGLIEAMRSVIEAADTADDIDSLIAAAYAAVETATHNRAAGVGALLTLEQMERTYADYIQHIAKRRFITGHDELDGVIKGVAPGETMFITAYSGLYKSALLQNLLLDGCARSQQYHLFFSMEMPSTRVFERTVQIGLGRYTYNIESEYHHHSPDKRSATMEQLRQIHADKLLVCEQGGLTIEKVEHYTRLGRAKYGDIGAIGIDYLGLMAADSARSEYERISYVAEQSKYLAKRLNIPVILLTQVSRAAASTGTIEMHSAKGSGAIEASADYLIGLQRDRDSSVILKVLKNRNGEAGSTFDVDIERPFLRFRCITAATSCTRGEASRGQARSKKIINLYDDDEGPY